MSNTMRWRYGDTNPVMLPVDAGQVVEIGDFMYLDGDNAKPISSHPDQGTQTANQEFLHDNFVGVAMQSTSGLATESIRVATSGVFEFECLTATFEVGDLLGGQEEGTGSRLHAQVVAGVATENLAVGRCVKRVPIAAGNVLVDIVSTVIRGGPQAAA